ncbi:hypothetical protein OG474_13440 [Kribbella sp. NBC_01505]|uniref:hypothetical protein n=1 Tax=Kribbella sp. NBC_01505 TaxID=2903580 RepID=UPI00386E4B27
MGDERGFRPEQLERLAGLIGKVAVSADDAFKQAGNLSATAQMTSLRELPGWAEKQDPDLRKRSSIIRLEGGDPLAGLAWAGFTPLELSANGDKLDPASLIFVNTVADYANKNHRTDLNRKSGESLDDYLKRLEAAAISKVIPALAPHEATVANVLKVVGDVRGVMTTGPIVTMQGAALLRLMANNKAWAPLTAKLTGGRFALQTRSAVAPGTYLGAITRKLFMKSALYRDTVALLPEFAEMDRVSGAVNGGRALLGTRVNNFLNLTFGNNSLAKVLGGTTHSGQAVTISGQANLLKVWAATGDASKLAESAAILGVDATKLTRFGALARTAGGLRTLGVVGQAGMTVYSAANVISQGNPVDAFKRNGAGYVADVAELGFNASLTAAMIAPNPFTIGATVVFGAVYVGAKVVEHWDDIKEGAGKVVDKVGGFVKKLNPFG